MAGSVGEDLDFHMAGVGNVAFEEHAVVAESSLGLAAGGVDGTGQVRLRVNEAHTAATSSGGCFDKEGEPLLRDELVHSWVVGEADGRTRDDWNTGLRGYVL